VTAPLAFNPRRPGTLARPDGHPEPGTVLFRSPLVRVGKFRCPVTHPRFRTAGEITAHVIVFPRTAVWIEHEGRAPVVGEPTRVMLYNPAQAYSRRAISPDGDRSDWFGVSADVLREVLSEVAPAAADREHVRFAHRLAAVDPRVYAFQRSIFERARLGAHADALEIEENVVSLLARVVSSAYGRRRLREAPPARQRDLAEATRAYIARTYDRKQGLGEVARAMGCSVFHLCRVFRRCTGQTLHEYRRDLRIRRSLEGVTSGDSDLLRLALDLGYSGHSHFTAAFRAAYGQTPTDLRHWFRDLCGP
jgi:AraC family transcriptional regulator